MHTVNIP